MPGSTDRPSGPAALRRLLRPESIAVVGAKDGPGNDGWRRLASGPAEVHFVNPTVAEVMGRPTVPDLSSIGAPVDVVLSLLGTGRTIEVCEEAASCGAGGVVAIAGGFAGEGPEGSANEGDLIAAARRGGFPVLGPNCAGYVDARRGLDLTFLPAFDRRPGGVSAVLQSGGVLLAIAAKARRPGGIGFNLLISSGNEAVTDMADYLDHLAADEATTVVLLAIETIRRPDAFFAAARRCHEAGKPLIALKIGRNDRSAGMSLSHTGAIAGDPWAYEVALRQANVLIADDVDELVERALLFDRTPRERWRRIEGVAAISGSGGMSAMALDIAEAEGVALPSVDELDRWMSTQVPGLTTANPLDLRGNARDELYRSVLERFARTAEFDAYAFLGQFAEWDLNARVRAEQLTSSSLADEKLLIISPLAGEPAPWVEEHLRPGVVFGSGIRNTFRALAAMASFMASSPESYVAPASSVDAVPPPGGDAAGLLPFVTTMDLLVDAGITVAPYVVLDPGDGVGGCSGLRQPFAVKLADISHRTEHGAVLTGITTADLPVAVDRMRHLAVEHDLPPRVAVQEQIAGRGEVFIGVQNTGRLGPLVAFGLGGVFLEAVRRVGGRMAPFSEPVAESLLAEFDDLGVFGGLRGEVPWPRVAIRDALVSVSRLAAGSAGWLAELDINPLIVTPDGLVAVDGLAVRHERPPDGGHHASRPIEQEPGGIHG